ncbi:MAG: M48 family metalloprotease, partial [Litorivicinus sp.]
RQQAGGDYVADPGLQAYVSRVGQSLAVFAERELAYEFVVVNDSSWNAWALPGGKIALNRGLLLAMEDEAELAAVLAHEIVHADAGHSANQMSKAQLGGLGIEILGALIDAPGTRQAAQQLGQISFAAVQAKFGRDDELEADHFGMRYMVSAGYDPQGAVRLQERFLQKFGAGSSNNLFASHPPSAERVERNRATAAQWAEGGRVGRDEYQAATKRLRITQAAYEHYDQGREALSNEAANEALIQANRAIKIEGREALFYDLKAQALLALDRKAEALKEANLAVKLNPDFHRHYLVRARIHRAMGRDDRAEDDYRQAQQRLPTAEASEFLGEALIDSDPVKARALLTQARDLGGDLGDKAQAELDLITLMETPASLVQVRVTGAGDVQLVTLINHAKVPVRHVRLAPADGGPLLRVRGTFDPGEHALTELPQGTLALAKHWQVVSADGVSLR